MSRLMAVATDTKWGKYCRDVSKRVAVDMQLMICEEQDNKL